MKRAKKIGRKKYSIEQVRKWQRRHRTLSEDYQKLLDSWKGWQERMQTKINDKNKEHREARASLEHKIAALEKRLLNAQAEEIGESPLFEDDEIEDEGGEPQDPPETDEADVAEDKSDDDVWDEDDDD